MAPVIDAMSEFPNLFQVFGGYLHQDFGLEFGSADEALGAAAAGQGSEMVGAAIVEIDGLLGRRLSHDELEAVIERLTIGYAPELEGWDAHEWLAHARAILEAGA
jgi:CdiI immunity protein